jgi:hypothetical protein
MLHSDYKCFLGTIFSCTQPNHSQYFSVKGERGKGKGLNFPFPFPFPFNLSPDQKRDYWV